MKMMNNKIKEGSKCKLSNYGKELLRDERRMRNIIDFSNKWLYFILNFTYIIFLEIETPLIAAAA